MKNVTKLLFSRLMMLTILSTMAFTKVGWTEVFVTCGTGTTVQSTHPFYTYYEDERSQYIYLASEMAPLIAGPITKLAVNFYSTSALPMNGFTISMQHTTMSSNTSAFVESGWQTVYYNASYNPPATGWQQFILDTPFNWDGSQNIYVQICWDNTTWTSPYARCYHTYQGTYRSIYRYSDGASGCSLTPASYISTYRPNMRFYQPSPGTLQGTVTSGATGLPIVGATIAGPFGSTTSGGGGAYSFTVFEGTADYTCTYSGYLNNIQSVTIPAGGTVTQNFVMQLPPSIQGIVTNAANGAPLNGVRILCNGEETITTAGGVYGPWVLNTAGNVSITYKKAGFDDYGWTGFLAGGSVNTINVGMAETTNPASQPFVATLNTPQTQVDLSWNLPRGYYELIYDDGIKDLTTVWAVGGNLNAVKFTALNYPVYVVKGSVNIGDASDYAPGTDPATLAPFQVQIFDATGPGGMPGNPMADPIDIQPTHFGWTFFDLPAWIGIGSGNFYLVMIQGGNSGVAARLGVDNSSNQLRSYSRYITGGGNWLPADGNFMMRLVVYGVGGPIADAPDAILGYQYWRLFQGQEANEPSWTSLNTTGNTNGVDTGWPSLPDSAYRWAVKTKYTFNRWSPPIFSNVLGKNRTANVTVNVTLTCAAHPLNGSLVTLTCLTPGADSVYSKATDATGTVNFPTVWKGPYHLNVTRSGYGSYDADVSIFADHVYDVTVLMEKVPPRNMFVDDLSLLSTWNPPTPIVNVFEDDFSSGSFYTKGWINSPGYWQINTGYGNPAPSAELGWFWMLTNYDNVNLTSPVVTGTGAPDFKLWYDVTLNDYGYTGQEYLDVEIKGGSGPWVSLASYVNNGDIPWQTEIKDISAYSNGTLQIRFRAHGADMWNIDYWNVDNVKIVATVPDPKPCILAYNVYLNGILDGVTMDTTYNIPPNHVTYGGTYEACVKAVYGSGYSTASCYTFTSHFLYPPTNLIADSVECVAYLTWVKPAMAGKIHVPAFKGTIEHTPSSIGPAPIDPSKPRSSWPPEHSNWRGSTAFGMDGSSGQYINFDVDNVGGMTNIGPLMPASWWMDIEFPVNQPDWAYVITYGGAIANHIWQVDRATGTGTDLGATGVTGTDILDIAADVTNPGIMYAVASNGSWVDTFYEIDPSGPSATLIGPTVNSAGMIGMAGDKDGNIWGYDLVNDQFYSVDKTTGVATVVGALGFNANYGQGMFFDEATNTVTMAAFNANSFMGEIRAVDVTTGGSTILSSTSDQIAGATLPVTAGGGDPPGLIGYKVYRDGAYIAYIGDKDTTWYYDYTVNPGLHSYEVSAWYDLSPYITPPPYFGESMLEGPDECNIICGRDLPFFEPWDQASFAYNDWTSEGNWTITTAVGNPVPSADFGWLPPAVDYEQSIVTPTLNAGPYTCATIWCDFDLKLVDRNVTGEEFLAVDIYKDGGWKNVAEFANNGSFEWTAQHYELKQTIGKAFMVRFRAHGANTQDILHWYVDNIHIYAVCTPPTNLAWYDINNNDVYLSWTPPVCQSGPEPRWITWDDGTNANSIGYGAPMTFSVASRWTPDLISDLDGGAITKIRFWPASTGGSSGIFTLRVWEGADAATLLVDQTLASVTYDDWNEATINSPAPIDISKELWFGYEVNGTGWPAGCDPGPAVANFGDMLFDGSAWVSISITYGLNYNWDLEAYIEPAKGANRNVINQTPVLASGTPSASPVAVEKQSGTPRSIAQARESSLLGYDIFRSLDSTATYQKINSSIVTDTTYADMAVPLYGDIYYYVTGVYPECDNSSDSSNILKVHLVVGIDQLNNGSIMVYPNPATENVNVKSDYTISRIEVMNYVGQTVYNRTNVEAKLAKINVANFQSGVYFVKVTTSQGVRTVKITVTK